jgi:diguanylate cyclase (GGDEF)-like protein/PAS domain S-box-containing protein
VAAGHLIASRKAASVSSVEHEALFHGTLTGVAEVRHGRFIRVNDELVRILGVAASELSGASARQLEAPPDDDDGAHAASRRQYEREYVRPDGDRRTLLIEAALVDEGPPATHFFSVIDVTERQQNAAELENARALLMRAVNSMSDGFVLFGPDDRIIVCNQVYAATLEGFQSAESMVGMHVETIIRRQIDHGQPVPPEHVGDIDHWVAERLAQHRRADGQPHVQQLSGGRWVQSIRHRTSDGNIVVLRSDITAFKERERAAQLLAQHDALTGLPNRRLLHDRLTQALARSRRSTESVAVLVIDLDGFKAVNDTHGHKSGDEVLRVTAERLKDCLRSADTVARFGGDEFIVVLDGLAPQTDVGAIAAKIIEAVKQPIPAPSMATGVTAIQIGCSIGISLYPRDAADPDSLMRLADAAMYKAKQAGRGRYAQHLPPE